MYVFSVYIYMYTYANIPTHMCIQTGELNPYIQQQKTFRSLFLCSSWAVCLTISNTSKIKISLVLLILSSFRFGCWFETMFSTSCAQTFMCSVWVCSIVSWTCSTARESLREHFCTGLRLLILFSFYLWNFFSLEKWNFSWSEEQPLFSRSTCHLPSCCRPLDSSFSSELDSF